MREARNPFRLRASEDIEADSTFLQLFGPDMLKALPEGWSWSDPLIVRSAPGGGKTSLMRLVTPGVLLTLVRLRRSDEFTDLYKRLKELNVLSAEGDDVELLGVYTSCNRHYEILEDLDTDVGRKKRLLLALLNSRIVLAGLRGAIRLAGAEFPGDLDEVVVRGGELSDVASGVEPPVSGDVLYEWAVEIERNICEALDSFGPLSDQKVVGHSSLFALDILEPQRIVFKGTRLVEKVTVLLDDIQYLSPRQRRFVYDAVVKRRSKTGVWLSERFEALSGTELLSEGAQEGRDYTDILTLEEFWRNRRSSFRKLVDNVGDRRARASSAAEINHFGGTLGQSIVSEEFGGVLGQALEDVKDRVYESTSGSTVFDEWIESVEKRDDDGLHSEVVTWRSLEILIKRERSRSQQSLGLTLNREHLEKKESAAVRKVAELFVSESYGLPYYYGFRRLAKLASSNVEQFLRIAGDEFEEIVSAYLIGQERLLSASRQQAILENSAAEYWGEIPSRVPTGHRVRDLLEGIIAFCQNETYRPTAPYSPGVTGVALTLGERNRLINERSKANGDLFEALRAVVSDAVAQNYLEADVGRKAKGKQWMVLYLNRLLCLRGRLPLDYGGYRRVSLRKLQAWSEGEQQTEVSEPALDLEGSRS